MKRRNAYTLIELLVAITIIGILMTIAAVGWSSVAARSRDDTRKTDMRRIKNMLEQYYADNRVYPKFVENSSGGRVNYSAQWQLTNSSGGCLDVSLTNRIAPRYTSTVPSAPKITKDFLTKDCTYISENQNDDYLYLSARAAIIDPAPKDYALMVKLEKTPAIGSNEAIPTNSNPLLSDPYSGAFTGYKILNPVPSSSDTFEQLIPNYMVVKGTAE